MSTKGSKKEKFLAVQVDPIELIHHDNAFTGTTHLEKDHPSFAEQCPQPEMRKPEEEFAMLNMLAKLFEALNKMDPNNPEGVVLRAMAKNYVTQETAPALNTGQPINAQKPDEFRNAEFVNAMKALAMKHKNDAPKRDAVMCVAAGVAGRPLTGTDVVMVFQNLAEGVELTPDQWEQLLRELMMAIKGMNEAAAKDMQRQMAEQGQMNAMGAVNAMQQNVRVRPDGTLEPAQGARVTQPAAAPQKVDEQMALLEMSRDFWLALFKAQQDKKLQDEAQRDTAQLLRNVGQKYVRTGRNAGMADAGAVDARANRFLIKKLRQNPAIRADEAKMAALDKLEKAEMTGRNPTPKELVEIFDALGKGVPMTPEMLRAILEYMIANMKGMKKPDDMRGMQPLLNSKGPVNPADAVRVMNTACMRKPEESAAIVELFANFFLAMAATKQNAALREQHQRNVADALTDAARVHGAAGEAERAKVDNDAYRMKLMKLRGDPHVTAAPAKKRAVEELVAAEATGRRLSQPQLQQVFEDLSRGMKMTPEMLKVILEYMATNMRAVTPNEKAEMQKRFKQNPPQDAADVVDEAGRVRQEQKEAADRAKMVGCFQILPDNHPAMQRQHVRTTQSKEVGMRAGPASIEWHQYKAVGLQPPEEEMARIVMVQAQLEDKKNFDDEKTQKTLMQEASQADVSFRSILQPSVMEKYQKSMSMAGNSQAVSVLQSMSQVGAMDDRQLNKKVDQLLSTMVIDRAKLRNVLQQMVKDRLMTNDEAKGVERQCEPLMASGGGKMKLIDLQNMMKGKTKTR